MTSKPDHPGRSWGENARPLWLCQTHLDPRENRGERSRADNWELDPEMPLTWARAQVLRRFTPGMPWIFLAGTDTPFDEDFIRENLKLHPVTVWGKIRDDGAISYEDPETGEVWEWEIRLENLEEAARFVQENRERRKRERQKAKDDAKKERRRLEREAFLAAHPEYQAEVYQKRRQAQQDAFARRLKERGKPEPRYIPKLTPEQREQKKQEAKAKRREYEASRRDERRIQAERARRKAGKPERKFFHQRVVQVERPHNVPHVHCDVWFRGEKTSLGKVAEIFGITRTAIMNYSSGGMDLVIDGERISLLPRPCPEPTLRAAKTSRGTRYQVGLSYRGKNTFWYQGVSLEKAESVLADLLKTGEWKKVEEGS